MKILSLSLASVGTIISLAVTIYGWSHRQAFGFGPLILIVLLALSVLGLCAAIQLHSGFSNFWNSIVWLVCGGLIAIMFIGITSVGPYLIPAILLFCGTAILASHWSLSNALFNIGTMFVCSVIIFALLMIYVTRYDVDMVDKPADSNIDRIFPEYDYVDAFRVELDSKPNRNISEIARIFYENLRPVWSKAIKAEDLDKLDFKPGKLLGGWEVFDNKVNEIIVGLNRSFIDLRLSILYSENENGSQITATTVAKYNNWKGKLYFLPIRFGHMIVLSDATRRLKYHLNH